MNKYPPWACLSELIPWHVFCLLLDNGYRKAPECDAHPKLIDPPI